MKDLLESQAKLLQVFGQQIYKAPAPDEIYNLRARLIEEESNELIEAIDKLCYMAKVDSDHYLAAKAHFLKEFSDLLVVMFGTAAQLGFTSEQLGLAFDIVDLDNQSKVYAHKSSAEDAKDYYESQGYKVQITEQEVNGYTFYAVRNETGKILKRYPGHETTAEERIHLYFIKGK